MEFTADLHSMGQYIQQGERHLFESVVRFGPSKNEMKVPFDAADGDGQLRRVQHQRGNRAERDLKTGDDLSTACGRSPSPRGEADKGVT